MTADFTLHAWVDESMHVDRDDGHYILAAVIGEAASCDLYRTTLRSLLDRGQSTLHWRIESHNRKAKMVETIAQFDLTAVVVIGSPLAKRKQERARALCMEYLVTDLAGRDVTQVLLEARTPSLNNRDQRLIDSIRSKKLIPDEMRIRVGQPTTEPMLWIPDIVAGAVGADRVRGNSRYLDPIRAMVDMQGVLLR